MAEARPACMERPEKLLLSYYDTAAYERLSLKLHKDDAMYWRNTAHYLSAGASALNVVKGGQSLAALKTFTSILDFGSGAGRVTRWLRAAYEDASITVADIRGEDVRFCSDNFGATTWNCGIDPSVMTAPGDYGLIWIGSVITHLPESTTMTLFRRVMERLRIGGVAAISFHGRFSFINRDRLKYGPQEMFSSIEKDYTDAGCAYRDYPGQSGYGISFCALNWVVEAIKQLPSCRLLSLSERSWNTHHDVMMIQRTS